jgi:hypothetical protein
MKVKMLLVAAALLAFAAAGFSQPMQYSLNNAPGDPYFGTMLTIACEGPGASIPIPDGEGTVWIYQDADGNGATDNDALVPLCDHPENECVGGPLGTFNMNSMLMNGMATIGEAGYFVSENYLTSYAAMPAGLPRFYCRVRYPNENPSVEWVSGVLTASSGVSDFFFVGWTCRTLIVPCVPTPDMTVPVIPVGATGPSYCNINLCPNTTFTLCVGPVYNETRLPLFTASACPGAVMPAGFAMNPFTYSTTPAGNFYCATMTATEAGCICLNYEGQLPVEMGNFAATGLDNSVKVAWNTLSENGQERFDIIRDGARIGSKAASNTATGATYEFVDNSATNGTTYSYELVAVALDGTVRSLATASATPSIDAAVITEYALGQNFPNPFNPSTKIAFDLVENNTVTLTIYNAAGQEVTSLMSNRTMTKGRHFVNFDATNLTSGLYFYTIKIGNEFSATKKMLLVK